MKPRPLSCDYYRVLFPEPSLQPQLITRPLMSPPQQWQTLPSLGTLTLRWFPSKNYIRSLNCNVSGMGVEDEEVKETIAIFTYNQLLLSIHIKTKFVQHVPRINISIWHINMSNVKYISLLGINMRTKIFRTLKHSDISGSQHCLTFRHCFRVTCSLGMILSCFYIYRWNFVQTIWALFTKVFMMTNINGLVSLVVYLVLYRWATPRLVVDAWQGSRHNIFRIHPKDIFPIWIQTK